MLSKLRAVAEAATPGPWKQDNRDGLWGYVYSPTETEDGADIARAYWSDTDADFIATFDPPTVLTLLDAASFVDDFLFGCEDPDGNLTDGNLAELREMAMGLAERLREVQP